MESKIPLEEVTVNRRVLVIGGGIGGLETAYAAAKAGLPVTLIEEGQELGGLVSSFNSFLESDVQPAEYINKKISTLKALANVDIYTSTKLVDLDGQIGEFEAHLLSDQKKIMLEVGAMVVAAGIQTVFCPVKYGLGMEGNVISQLALEKSLANGRDFKDKKVTFIVGMTTEDYVVPYVSALKNAVLIRERDGAQVNVFYKNMKVAGDGWEALYNKAREIGVNFYKFEENLDISNRDGQIVINYKDPFLSAKIPGTYKVASDYVVLPEELLPPEGIEQLAQILKIEIDKANFIGEDNIHLLPEFTARDGIYVVGSCQSPNTLPEIEVSVGTIIGEIIKKMPSNKFSIEATQPQVDATKCVVCLTCYRCCPHQAIKIVHDKDNYQNLYYSAAKMNPLACRRCGVCAAECPGKAIQLPEYSDESILAQIEGVGVLR